MQISALNLIIAAQQARQTAAQNAPAAQSAPTAKPQPAKLGDRLQASAEFVPFGEAAETAAAKSDAPASAPSPNTPIGSQIDIRV